MAWSFARLKLFHPALQSIALEVVPRMHELKPQEAANISWALATLKMHVPGYMEALESRGWEEVDPRNVSNILWSCGMLSIVNEPLIDALLSPWCQRQKELGPQTLANTLWAVATMQYDLSEDLVQVMVTSVTHRIWEFKQ